MIGIKYEGKTTLESIQKDFSKHLSEKQIKRTTASALNVTAIRMRKPIKDDVSTKYSITKKYLGDLMYISKKATPTTSGLYTEVSFSYRPYPLIAFPVTQTKTGLQIEVKRGQKRSFRGGFVATMKTGHRGAFGHFQYKGGKFVPIKGKTSEIKTVSPFTMSLSEEVASNTEKKIKNDLPPRLQAMLQVQLNKMIK